MKQICAWCKKDIGEIEIEDTDPDAISHGMCKECAFHLSAQRGMPLRQFLDGLGKPIIAVDSDAVIHVSNREAEELLGRTRNEIEGQYLGDVFECDYSFLPEGCGRTIHCVACAIRRCVNETYETGNSCTRIPAHLNHEKSEGVDEIHFIISTEKLGNIVLLRIDEVGEPGD